MALQMTTKGLVADLCFAGFFFPQKSVCLKGRALGGGGVFDLLIHSSNGHSSQAEARNSILAAHPWAILCCLAMHIRRELAQNPGRQDSNQHPDRRCRGPRQQLNQPATGPTLILGS